LHSTHGTTSQFGWWTFTAAAPAPFWFFEVRGRLDPIPLVVVVVLLVVAAVLLLLALGCDFEPA
jgi:RsiW-degrading membrane proteinase PrsW (M82 family)